MQLPAPSNPAPLHAPAPLPPCPAHVPWSRGWTWRCWWSAGSGGVPRRSSWGATPRARPGCSAGPRCSGGTQRTPAPSERPAQLQPPPPTHPRPWHLPPPCGSQQCQERHMVPVPLLLSLLPPGPLRQAGLGSCPGSRPSCGADVAMPQSPPATLCLRTCTVMVMAGHAWVSLLPASSPSSGLDVLNDSNESSLSASAKRLEVVLGTHGDQLGGGSAP